MGETDYINLRADQQFWDWLSTPASPNYKPNEEVGSMSDIEMELERWKKIVYGPNGDGKHRTEDDYKTTVIHEVWEPKWKWFKPPIGWRIFGHRIFRWAYKIKHGAYTGVYPVALGGDMTIESSMKDVKINQVAIGGDGSVQTQIGIVFDGIAHRYSHPEIEKKAEEILKNLDVMSKVKEGDDQC